MGSPRLLLSTRFANLHYCRFAIRDTQGWRNLLKAQQLRNWVTKPTWSGRAVWHQVCGRGTNVTNFFSVVQRQSRYWADPSICYGAFFGLGFALVYGSPADAESCGISLLSPFSASPLKCRAYCATSTIAGAVGIDTRQFLWIEKRSKGGLRFAALFAFRPVTGSPNALGLVCQPRT